MNFQRYGLTFKKRSSKISGYSNDREKYPTGSRKENPRAGERGRVACGEYTFEPTPEREKSPVGTFRERPLQRGSVFALREASVREEDANQRWYRAYSPSVPARDGGLFNLFGRGRINMTCYEDLVARGLIAQVTDEEKIRDLIDNGKAIFYIGYDPTACSLTAGHFMTLTLMKRLQMAGNRPIALLGGGTGYIGDPSGRTDMRKMLTPEDIQYNCICFKKQMSRFIDFGPGKAICANNAEWLLKLNYVDLLREVGACFSVNNMLRAECYKQRMEKGLSFLEFNYMIMQSYDFYQLYQRYGCNLQLGGDDQWSNMLGGTELIRRKLGKDAYALTITLLTDSQGKKMGKTAGNAVWLDPNKTTPFEFYQYWRNVNDSDVLKCIRMLTFLPVEEINEMDRWEGSQLNRAKEILAFELTKLVHGEAAAKKAEATAKELFSGEGAAEHMPSTELPTAQFAGGRIGAMNLLTACGLCASNGEARRLIQQGGVSVNDHKVTDINAAFDQNDFRGDGVIIRKGKKIFHRAYITE